MPGRIVKACPCCGEEFTLEDIVFRRDIDPIGLLIEDDDMARNFFYFNHYVSFCGTTFTIPVEKLRSLVCENIPAEKLAGTPECRQHCLDLHDVDPCDRDCRNAAYRKLLECLKDIRRHPASRPHALDRLIH